MEIDRQRVAGEPLRDQLLWRIDALGGDVDLSVPENGDLFEELWDAFTLPGTSLVPMPDSCASISGGGTIFVSAFLVTGNSPIAYLKRRLLFQDARVIHELLVVFPPYRGRGANLAVLTQSFAFFDQLGMKEVYLEAALATGRWHWARVGFEFARQADLVAVRDWALQVTSAVGVKGLRVDTYTTASQFARMGGRRKLSLEEIAAAVPADRNRIAAAATGNDLAMDERIALGRAVMITGPSWFGRLDLRGPSRAAFNAYAAAKVQRLRNP